MKFHVTWKIPQDKWLPVLKAFGTMTPKQRVDVGAGVKLIGRWHDLVARTGVAIFESDDLHAMHRYGLQWTPHMDLTITPMVEDEEAVELTRPLWADSKS
jgi:hypothetical protein